MSKYIVKNCPALEDILNYEVQDGLIIETGIDTANYCIKYKKTCDKISDCVIKRVIDDCETEYHTPKYFEKLEKTARESGDMFEY